jgi:hypothetical protein
MKMYAFRVQQRGPRPLEQVLEAIQAMPLGQRDFLGSSGMRLETAQNIRGLWFADFAAPRRGHGPGRMGRQTPLEGIELDEGYQFAEDTGIAYDPLTRHLAIQYKHYGPRSTGIQQYLAAADLRLGGIPPAPEGTPQIDVCGFSIGAVLKPDAYARLRRWGIYKSVEIDVALPGVVPEDLGLGRSLSSVLSAPLPDGVGSIKIGMHAVPGRDGGLGNSAVHGIIEDIGRLGTAVKSAVVRGKPTDTDRMDAVNLVSDRVSHEASIDLGHGLRYVRNDRWETLEHTLRQWQADGRLPA